MRILNIGGHIINRLVQGNLAIFNIFITCGTAVSLLEIDPTDKLPTM